MNHKSSVNGTFRFARRLWKLWQVNTNDDLKFKQLLCVKNERYVNQEFKVAKMWRHNTTQQLIKWWRKNDSSYLISGFYSNLKCICSLNSSWVRKVYGTHTRFYCTYETCTGCEGFRRTNSRKRQDKTMANRLVKPKIGKSDVYSIILGSDTKPNKGLLACFRARMSIPRDHQTH